MRADIGGGRNMIDPMPRRRARPHLLTASGWRLMMVGALAAALLVGAGVLAERSNAKASASAPSPLGLIGR